MALSNDISRITATQSMYDTSSYNKSVKKEDATNKAAPTETKSASKISGRTVGDVKLSEKAAKYYEKLKAKYPGMDFVLVAADQKDKVEANAAAYGQANKTVVLIDDEKIEKMAGDEKYAGKVEAIITNAEAQLKAVGSGLFGTGADVQGYGMKINDDGTATLFAVLKDSSKAQKARIEKKAAEKKAEEKAQHKKLEEKRAEKKADAKEAEEARKAEKSKAHDDDEYITITANTAYELLKKITDQAMLFRSDSVRCEEEMTVGQNFDFNV
ncbi:hypothetical protein SAMN02745229_01280 [Butyrivibrio fibrisolvens DSM 3071]|uniref:Uncharacterized protein n=1 Tax=Butyrivibrio fibrisolvens DSM 3071 TaxID=1121131 RepID=A0A1M5X457_BUTFI|nr:DUF6033 family protein [Butyrivibrio fibrisolvens]SHH94606.1 hypothetical protein SAMN02745229_01280 [Butyrivibrio fibrisolvens DSM 3071]